MILCSLELHSSQMQKSLHLSFVSLSLSLSLWRVLPFVFKSFLFNSHQIKPSPISSSLIVYLFIFGLCFVFCSTNSNPFIYFFSCVFFLGGSWSLLADQMVMYTRQRNKLTHEIQGYTLQDCPNFPFFYDLCSLEIHSSGAKITLYLLFFLFEGEGGRGKISFCFQILLFFAIKSNIWRLFL